MEHSANGAATGADEYKLPGCGQGVLGVLLFAVPGLFLLLVVSIGLAYGSGSALVIVYSVVLMLGVALAGRGITSERLVAHGVLFAVLTVATLTLGSLLG